MIRVGIIGGGPGGLMTAHLLERTFGTFCRVTLLEATGRVGGKVRTVRFDAAPAFYEAGSPNATPTTRSATIRYVS